MSGAGGVGSVLFSDDSELNHIVHDVSYDFDTTLHHQNQNFLAKTYPALNRGCGFLDERDSYSAPAYSASANSANTLPRNGSSDSIQELANQQQNAGEFFRHGFCDENDDSTTVLLSSFGQTVDSFGTFVPPLPPPMIPITPSNTATTSTTFSTNQSGPPKTILEAIGMKPSQKNATNPLTTMSVLPSQKNISRKSSFLASRGLPVDFTTSSSICSTTVRSASADISNVSLPSLSTLVRVLPQTMMHGVPPAAMSNNNLSERSVLKNGANETTVSTNLVSLDDESQRREKKRKKSSDAVTTREESEPIGESVGLKQNKVVPPNLIRLEKDFLKKRLDSSADLYALPLQPELQKDIDSIRKSILVAARHVQKNNDTNFGGIFYALLGRLEHELTFRFVATLFGKKILFPDEESLKSAQEYALSVVETNFDLSLIEFSMLASFFSEQSRITAITESYGSDKRVQSTSTKEVSTVLQLVAPKLLKVVAQTDRNGISFCQRLNWLVFCFDNMNQSTLCTGVVRVLSLAYYSKTLFQSVYNSCVLVKNVSTSIVSQLLHIARNDVVASLAYYTLEFPNSGIDEIVQRTAYLSNELQFVQARFEDNSRLMRHVLHSLYSKIGSESILPKIQVIFGNEEHKKRQKIVDLLDIALQREHSTCYEILFRMLIAAQETPEQTWLQSIQSTSKSYDVLQSMTQYVTDVATMDWQSLVNNLMSEDVVVEPNTVAIASNNGEFIQLPVAVRFKPTGNEKKPVLLFDGASDNQKFKFLNLLSEPGQILSGDATANHSASKCQVFVRLFENNSLSAPGWHDLETVFHCQSFDNAMFDKFILLPNRPRLMDRFQQCAEVIDSHLESVAGLAELHQSLSLHLALGDDVKLLRQQQFVRVRHTNVQQELDSTDQFVHKTFLKKFLALALQKDGSVDEIVEQLCTENGNDFQVDVVNFTAVRE